MFSQSFYTNDDVETALKVLALSPSLNTKANQNFIKTHPEQAFSIDHILRILNSTSPKLNTTENFDKLLLNIKYINKITSVFSNLDFELRTQHNFDALIQHKEFLDKISKRIVEALPYAGGINPIPPLDQEGFDAIIKKIQTTNEKDKEQKCVGRKRK